MSTIETRNAILQMVEEGAIGLLPKYLERLHDTDQATIDDQRKAVDLMFKAMGIGVAEKGDSRVVVDIHIENGLVTSASPIVLENSPAIDLLEHVASTEELPAPVLTPETALANSLPDMDVDAMMAQLEEDLSPITEQGT
jgi:hypothetical protein